MSESRKAEETLTFDVAVIGGGTAGLAAAVAAARSGAKTAIVQDRPVFGGNSSSEIRVAPLGSVNINAWSRETGILEEWLLTERSRNHDEVQNGMANSHYDLVLHESARNEANLTMFLNCSVRGVEVEPVDPSTPDGPRRILSVRGSQLASEKELRIEAKAFADCTGDATVGALGGAAFRYGRESRNEFNENMAPVKADDQTQGSSIVLRARDIGRPVPYQAPSWAQDYRTLEEIGLDREPTRLTRADYSGWWWIEIGTPFHQIDENQEIKDELLRHVLGVWNFVKNYSEDKALAANYALEWVGMIPGKRESRRLVGDLILTEHDLHKDPEWPDTVCHGGWFIDLHTMGALLNKSEPGEPSIDAHYRYWVRVAPFSIPLRCLYSKNVENLWMAGRNISVTHVALGATRVMMTNAAQGQAIGSAAAMAVRASLTAREIANPDGEHIGKLQQELLKEDLNVFKVKNSDPEDLALSAQATASSEAALDFGNAVPGCLHPLEKGLCMNFPLTEDHIDSVEVYLRNQSDSAVSVKAELHALNDIWERKHGQVLAKSERNLPAGFEGWVDLGISVKTKRNRCHRVMLHQADGVSWAGSEFYPTGVAPQVLHKCPGGCEPKNLHMNSLQPQETRLPPYELWSQYRIRNALALRFTPMSKPFAAANAVNGLAWPLAMPNLWVSDPAQLLPQSLTLELPEEKTISKVMVSMDTHLDYSYKSMSAYWKAHTCAKHWRLKVRVGGKWHQVYEEHDNMLRRRTAVFDAVKADAVQIEILSTNMETVDAKPDDHPLKHSELEQAKSARVYEVRIYS